MFTESNRLEKYRMAVDLCKDGISRVELSNKLNVKHNISKTYMHDITKRLIEIGALSKERIGKLIFFKAIRDVSDFELLSIISIKRDNNGNNVILSSGTSRIFTSDMHHDLHIQQSRQNRRSATPRGIASSFYVL